MLQYIFLQKNKVKNNLNVHIFRRERERERKIMVKKPFIIISRAILLFKIKKFYFDCYYLRAKYDYIINYF